MPRQDSLSGVARCRLQEPGNQPTVIASVRGTRPSPAGAGARGESRETELLADWEASQRPPSEVVQIVGEERERRSHELRDMFARIGIPFGFYTPTSPEAAAILERAQPASPRLPVVAFRSGTVLPDPPYQRILEALGFSTEPEASRCDLAIIGGGPAGLAAAVYGASEGLATVLIDHGLPGGQAGTSSRIRNYLGFPTGLSGRDLTNRALEQAWFFGARFVLSRRATALAPAGDGYRIELQDAKGIEARAVVVSTGVTWRRLEVASLDELLGAGVFYGAALSDAAVVEGARVFVVGAGNSAGQAAVHLAAAGATSRSSSARRASARACPSTSCASSSKRRDHNPTTHRGGRRQRPYARHRPHAPSQRRWLDRGRGCRPALRAVDPSLPWPSSTGGG